LLDGRCPELGFRRPYLRHAGLGGPDVYARHPVKVHDRVPELVAPGGEAPGGQPLGQCDADGRERTADAPPDAHDRSTAGTDHVGDVRLDAASPSRRGVESRAVRLRSEDVDGHRLVEGEVAVFVEVPVYPPTPEPDAGDTQSLGHVLARVPEIVVWLS